MLQVSAVLLEEEKASTGWMQPDKYRRLVAVVVVQSEKADFRIRMMNLKFLLFENQTDGVFCNNKVLPD